MEPRGDSETSKSSNKVALARWLSQLRHHPVHQKVVGSIPGQGTCLGCGFDPCWGKFRRQLIGGCFSLTSMFLSLSLKSIYIYLHPSSGEDLKQ